MFKMSVWWESVKQSLRSEEGQGMVEYALVLAFVAVVAAVFSTGAGAALVTAITGTLTTITGLL